MSAPSSSALLLKLPEAHQDNYAHRNYRSRCQHTVCFHSGNHAHPTRHETSFFESNYRLSPATSKSCSANNDDERTYARLGYFTCSSHDCSSCSTNSTASTANDCAAANGGSSAASRVCDSANANSNTCAPRSRARTRACATSSNGTSGKPASSAVN